MQSEVVLDNLEKENNLQKQKFYIFLDFDGVLNDIENMPYLWKLGGFFVDDKDKDTFNPESIAALNYLIETLKSEYDVNLVLSTTWRRWFEKAKSVLKNNGLEYCGEIDKTPKMFLKKRAFEIMAYLQGKNEDHNFVVIDDKSHLPKYFKDSNSIKTNIVNGSLNMSNMLNYIDTYFPHLASKNPLKDIYEFEKSKSENSIKDKTADDFENSKK